MNNAKKRVLSFSIIVFLIILVSGVVLFLNQDRGYFIFSSPELNQTYVSFRFDDGLTSQKFAFDILKRYNYSGSMYVITSKPDSNISWEDNYYLNWTEIRNYSSFMEIGSHTRYHTDLINSKKLSEEVIGSKQDLMNRGFNSSTFVYPGGDYDRRAVNLVAGNYDCASTQDVGTNSLPLRNYLIKDFTFRKSSNEQTITRVIKKGKWNVLTFHDINLNNTSEIPLLYSRVASQNSVSLELFNQIVQYINKNNITVITLDEGCKLFKND